MYRLLYWLVLGRLPAEAMHRAAFGVLRAACAIPGVRALIARLCAPRDPVLRVRAFGREFPSPLGLAAGFDKNAVGIDALLALGFGFVEVGTVTAEAQPGNPKPRLFRRTKERALVNRMGFNNDGAAAIARRLAQRRGGGIVGVNIGKTRRVSEEDAVEDYARSATVLAPYADYLVVNVSSPNTPGLRDLQAVAKLRPLLERVRAACDQASPMRRVPLLVKIAPDLADEDVDAVAELAMEVGLDGIVATNTTKVDGGGLSGRPLKERALAVLRRVRARVGEGVVLVAVGGIENAEDAWERIHAGATLVQAYTGFVYGGPGWVRSTQRRLASSLVREAQPDARVAR